MPSMQRKIDATNMRHTYLTHLEKTGLKKEREGEAVPAPVIEVVSRPAHDHTKLFVLPEELAAARLQTRGSGLGQRFFDLTTFGLGHRTTGQIKSSPRSKRYHCRCPEVNGGDLGH